MNTPVEKMFAVNKHDAIRSHVGVFLVLTIVFTIFSLFISSPGLVLVGISVLTVYCLCYFVIIPRGYIKLAIIIVNITLTTAATISIWSIDQHQSLYITYVLPVIFTYYYFNLRDAIVVFITCLVLGMVPIFLPQFKLDTGISFVTNDLILASISFLMIIAILWVLVRENSVSNRLLKQSKGLIKELSLTQENLEEKERRLSEVNHAARIGHWEWDLETKTLVWSKEIYEIFGYNEKDEPSFERYINRIHPEDRDRVSKLINQSIERQRVNPIEYKIKVGNETRYLKSFGKFYHRDGKGPLMIGSVQDITDLHRKEQELSHRLDEKELLLREIHHRVKNNMQIILSFMQLYQDSTGTDTDEFLRETILRIKSMSIIHGILYRQSDLAEISTVAYLTELIPEYVQNSGNSKLFDIIVKPEDLQLSLDTTMTIGLIITELNMNSFKHGLRETGDQIKITIENYQDNIVLTHWDTGSGSIDLSKKGIGLNLVEALVRQLEGTLLILHDKTVKITFSMKS